MRAQLRKMIEAEAKADAVLFAKEFGGALESVTPARDAEDRQMWELYRSTLIAELLRLIARFKVSP